MRVLACSALLLAFAGSSNASEIPGQLITVNGHALYVEVRGQGQPLVLLHGGGDSIRLSFENVMDRLSIGHRIVAIEQVAQGHSPDVPGPITYQGMTNDTAAVLSKLGIVDADVIGRSDGGIIALMLASQHPDQVRKVVASGANYSPDAIPTSMREEVRKAAPEDLFSDEEKAEIQRLAHENGVPVAIVGPKLKALWLNSPTDKELNLKILASIKQPVLLISGDHDLIMLEHTVTMFHALPAGQLWIAPNTGHAVFQQRPALASEIILAFLEGEK